MRIKGMNTIKVRQIDPSELYACNLIIESAVLNWPLPERVKRLAVPVLKYDAVDLQYMKVFVATYAHEIVGVAAWDPSPVHELPTGDGGLFHGLYVLPLAQGQGVGVKLMEAVFADARTSDSLGLLIKAQRISQGYFEHHNFEALAANDSEYPWQYWKQLG